MEFTMTNRTETIITPEAVFSDALDAAAPSEELWLNGEAAYHEAIEKNPIDRESAYIAALDAAAPSEELWLNGYDILASYGLVSPLDSTKRKFNARGALSALMSRKANILGVIIALVVMMTIWGVFFTYAPYFIRFVVAFIAIPVFAYFIGGLIRDRYTRKSKKASQA